MHFVSPHCWPSFFSGLHSAMSRRHKAQCSGRWNWEFLTRGKNMGNWIHRNLDKYIKWSFSIYYSGTGTQRCLALNWRKLTESLRCLPNIFLYLQLNALAALKQVCSERRTAHATSLSLESIFPRPLSWSICLLIVTKPRTHVPGTLGVHWWFKTRPQVAGRSLVEKKKLNLSFCQACSCSSTLHPRLPITRWVSAL